MSIIIFILSICLILSLSLIIAFFGFRKKALGFLGFLNNLKKGLGFLGF